MIRIEQLIIRNRASIVEFLEPCANEVLTLTHMIRPFGIEMDSFNFPKSNLLVGFLLDALLESSQEKWDPMDIVMLASDLGWEGADSFWTYGPYLMAKCLWEG